MRTVWLSALLLACSPSAPEAEDEVVVFAAASLTELVGELARAWTATSGVPVVTNLAGSNTLALQLEATPAADLFVSADRAWMDHLDAVGRLAPGTRRDLWTNQLVVLAHADADLVVTTPADLPALPFRHLALGDPRGVPAGRYARQWLDDLGLWGAVEARVVPALDVRAACALVRADPSTVGIVYRTDAAAAPGTRVLYEVPADQGPRVTYVGALIDRPRTAAADAFLAWLDGAEARAIAARHGFGAP